MLHAVRRDLGAGVLPERLAGLRVDLEAREVRGLDRDADPVAGREDDRAVPEPNLEALDLPGREQPLLAEAQAVARSSTRSVTSIARPSG